MGKQSFAKYLESREQLLQAITKDPIVSIQYEITKYSKLILDESYNMRPQQRITIKWKYTSVDEKPIPIDITIPQTTSITPLTGLYDSQTMFKWLNSNARELKHDKI